jgi:catechol 2,3-dioxygenase
MKYERLIDNLAEVALRVPSESWRDTVDYYVSLIGMNVVENDEQVALLRAKRDRFHHTLSLIRSDRPGMERAMWHVPCPDDLLTISTRLARHGLETQSLPTGAIPGVGHAVAVRDFGDHQMVFSSMIEQCPPRPEPYRGASVHFLDHLNLNYATDLERARAAYVDGLGLRITDTATMNGSTIGYWLSAGELHHDLAIMVGGDFLHHVAFRCVSPDDLRRAADQFADLEYPIDHGPAAHSPMGMYFLYVKDPAGNRNELFADEVRCWAGWEAGAYTDQTSGYYALERLLARYGPVPQPEFYVTGT